jgi:hypothetical protein
MSLPDRQCRFRKEMREHAAHEMRDDLTVGERAIDRGAHRAEIALPQFRADRCAGELEIGQRDVVRRRGERHLAQKLYADLMAETARAAMNADNDIAGRKAKALGDGIV